MIWRVLQPGNRLKINKIGKNFKNNRKKHVFSEVDIRKLIDIKLIADYITTRDKKRQCLDDWNPESQRL